MKALLLFCVIATFVAIDYAWGQRFQRCKKISDCPCGSQCVSWYRRRGNPRTPCRRSHQLCLCQRGCVVANIFIPAGRMNSRTYCNRCTCVENSQGIPACTKNAWCSLPKYLPLYPENPRCRHTDDHDYWVGPK